MKNIKSQHFECTQCKAKSLSSMKELFCRKCNSPLKLSNICYTFYPYNGKQPQNNYFAQESRLKSLFGENIVTQGDFFQQLRQVSEQRGINPKTMPLRYEKRPAKKRDTGHGCDEI